MDKCEYLCVDCKKPLNVNQNKVICPRCKKSWEINDGIIDFSNTDFYWNQVSTKEMNLIIKTAKNKGWKNAIMDFWGDDKKYLQDYIMKSSRADWMIFAPIKSSSRVLDMGAGWGAVTVELAKKYNEVYAGDLNIDTLKFIKIRADQEGITNLKLIALNPLDYPVFPFEKSFFNLIVLNGLLEWVGSARIDESPYRVQLDALKALHNILKPNGYIYLGIENRWFFRHFLAGTPHGEIPFASVLPRKLANFLTKIIRNKHHRTYIYSKKGYIKLFDKAGYKIEKIYALKPGYHFPRTIIPIDGITKYYLKNSYTKSDNFLIKCFKNLLNILPGYLLVSSFGIFAKKIDDNDN